MGIKQTTTLIDKAPKITQKQRISRVSTNIISVRHAPEGTKPKTVAEFERVAKQYWEFGVDLKERRGPIYDTYPFRCLFSSKKQAEETRKEIEKTMIDRNIKAAMEEYKKSKWKEEAERWGEEYKDDDEGDTNEI